MSGNQPVPNTPSPSQCRARGFSMLELMAVVAVMVILMAVALPTLLRSVRVYQLENTTRQVASVVMRTRYEAVQRNQRLGTTGSWPTATTQARFGMDLNADGVLQVAPAGREPYIQSPNMVWIITGAPFWTGPCGVPAGYTNVIFPPNWRVAFAPRGTVTEENPAGSGNWVDATGVHVFSLWQFDIAEPWSWRWMAVAVTPGGRVRVFRFQRTGPGGCGPNGDYLWVS